MTTNYQETNCKLSRFKLLMVCFEHVIRQEQDLIMEHEEIFGVSI